MWGRTAPPLTLLLLLLLHTSHSCKLSEFACRDGQQCIPSGRYCDGNDDCDDASDEPSLCTNCNRTFYAEANVKSSLHMSVPRQKPGSSSPFVCSMTFVGGVEIGDRLQLNFLSVQIGSLEKNNFSSLTCTNGYLQIIEAEESGGQQTRGFSQLLSAFKEPTETLSSLFYMDSPRFGRICGDMVGRSATFFAEGNNVTITAVVPTSRASFTVYLTYKYLESLQSDKIINQSYHYGNKMTNTYCDRVFVNCDQKRCSIRSPNFPGFYLRNITCHYWIRQESIPHGHHAKIVISQSNEYKISLYTGRTGPQVVSGLTEECHGDVMRVYDGNSTEAPLLLEFCGAGTLSEIISSSSEILVQLYSFPSQVMHNSFVELDVEVRFTEASEFRVQHGKCDFTVKGSEHRSGLVYSPRHTIARNTTCTFRLSGANPHDRIWFYFLSYFVEDKHPWTRRETCEVGKLEISEPGESMRERAALLVSSDFVERRTPDSTLVYRFCEKNIPNVCARAADNLMHVPVRPCTLPEESYLTRGSELLVKHNVYSSPELSTWSSSFTLRYEFVDMRQHGTPTDDICSRKFNSRSGQRVGAFNSPKNVFLFGRGGNKDISCSYEFLGHRRERISITFTDLKLKSNFSHCRHIFDRQTLRHTCVFGVGESATVTVVERTSENVESPLACICAFKSDLLRPVAIQSVTNYVRIDFKVTDMTAYDDFEDYGFDAVYEFLPGDHLCGEAISRNSSSEGEVIFQVPTTVEGRAVPLRCRWYLEATPHRYLYMRFNAISKTEDCTDDLNKIIVYSTLPVAPITVVCVPSTYSSENNKEINVFSNNWYNDSLLLLRDHVYIEVLASSAGTLRFQWMELTKPTRTLKGSWCQYECPDIGACIPVELWCDGRRHCPSGHDESQCESLFLPYLIAVAAAILLVLMIFVTFAAVRYRRRSELFKQSQPVPTDDFQMDINDRL